MSSRRSRGIPWTLIIVGAVGIVIVGGGLALRSRTQEPTADPSIAASGSSGAELAALLAAPAGSAQFGDVDGVKSQILTKTSLADAIGVARPLMSNTVGRLDVGSALLAMWASKNLSWHDLEALPETSPALFKKDPEAERGHRLCLSGTILEIRAETTLANRLSEDKALPLIERPSSAQPSTESDDGYGHPESPPSSLASSEIPSEPALAPGMDFAIPDGGKVYIATLQSKPEPAPEGAKPKAPHDPVFVEIIAVKSSGTLVDGNEARVCGILTGVTVPPAGVSTIAAIDTSNVHRVVGMFDLPENRTGNGVQVAAQH